MFELTIYVQALAVMLVFIAAGWLLSLPLRNASIVDSMWSIMFLLAGWSYAWQSGNFGPRSVLVLTLLTAWALRLSLFITWRNHGEGEDRRYQAMRKRNDPGFAYKSLYRVFILQALIAWIISVPLLAAILGDGPLGLIDYAGAAVWLIGFVFEAGGDLQLSRFKADPGNRGKVMDTGLWRYTRHPNYFGDAMIWWGFFLLAVAGGGWWTVYAPVIMTLLLLKVSGVALLEKDIGERRPAYRDYIARTNAFIPGPPRRTGT